MKKKYDSFISKSEKLKFKEKLKKNKKKKRYHYPNTVEMHISFRTEEEIALINRIKHKCEDEGIQLRAVVVGALFEIDYLKKNYLDYIIEVGMKNDKRKEKTESNNASN